MKMGVQHRETFAYGEVFERNVGKNKSWGSTRFELPVEDGASCTPAFQVSIFAMPLMDWTGRGRGGSPAGRPLPVSMIFDAQVPFNQTRAGDGKSLWSKPFLDPRKSPVLA